MERISKFRAVALLLIFAIILSLFSIKLFKLQIIETDGNRDNTTRYTSITRVKASRGDILDRNGNILVGNRASYDLVFNHYVINSADGGNEALHRLLQKCQEIGISYNDHFPVTKSRPFEYTLDDYSTAWRGYFQKYMINNSIDSDITAPLLLQMLRDQYDIPAGWTDEEARAVIGLRYEFDLRGVAPLPNYTFIEDISDKDLSLLLELNVPGLMVESSTVREYHTNYAAHILGNVGAINPDQWPEYKEKGYAMDAIIGQSGFEMAFEEYLHGVDGTRIDVVSKDGTIISQNYKEGFEPKAGNNVETTIDLPLQIIAEDALAQVMADITNPEINPEDKAGKDAEGAAVVVMDTRNGQILACASYPTFDIMHYVEKFDEIKEQDFAPMFNRAFMAAYAPGSSYKMCTLTAAMRAGKYHYGDTIEDEGVFTKYDGFRPECLLYTMTQGGSTHGIIDCVEALEQSCNYFFYVLGDSMTNEELDSTAKGFGLGEHTGIEMPENLGQRANPETKAKVFEGIFSGWFKGDQVLAAIGQSENRFTPLQLCVYASTLANKGVRLKATFLNRVVSSDYRSLVMQNEREVMSTMEINDEIYRSYMEGMIAVVKGDHGTAHKTLANMPVSVAAKTGTAEHGSGGSAHGSFICFAPAENPEIAVAVYGEKAGHGSTMGRVARKIIEYYFDTDTVSDVITFENRLG